MNKRIAKKKYKQALEARRTARKTGISVMIINQIFVDENGKPCDAMKKGSRLITLKRPMIRYIKSNSFMEYMKCGGKKNLPECYTPNNSGLNKDLGEKCI